MKKKIKLINYKASDGSTVKEGQTVTVTYYVALTQEDLVQSNFLDSSYTRGEPVTFTIGAGHVLKGIDIAVRDMTIGSTKYFIISSDLAFNEKGVPNLIPPNSDLVFELYLVSAEPI